MSLPLRIAVIAHLRHPIIAPFMGGMETHCDLLVRALIDAGHDVTLFASGDSDQNLPVHAIARRAYEATLPWAFWHGRPELRAWLTAAYQRCWNAVRAGAFDIVHNNSLFPDIHDWAAEDAVPMVTSLHVPPFRLLADAVARADASWVRYTVPSQSQRMLWPQIADDRMTVAWNGIEMANWPFVPTGNGRAVWFGRITPTKGTVEALRAATLAHIGLDVIGPIECRDYFAEVERLITGSHRYLGQLSGRALADAVATASVMVATPMWDEPFGLTLIEAMACGVPVAALDRGAMREVIGDTGTIAPDVASLPAAIASALTKDRQLARARVARHFTAAAMVESYTDCYATAMASLADAARASRIRSTDALLA